MTKLIKDFKSFTFSGKAQVVPIKVKSGREKKIMVFKKSKKKLRLRCVPVKSVYQEDFKFRDQSLE